MSAETDSENAIKQPQYKLFSQVAEEWVEHIKAPKQPFSLLFPEIDKDMGNNLEGKLIPVLGKGGTRKTIYAMNIGIHNALENNARTIYSSMEMGNLPLFERLVNYIFREPHKQGSEELRKLEKQQPGITGKMLTDQGQLIQDNFIFMEQAAMTPEDYERLLSEVTQQHGKVHFLIVDGLSMMGGLGREVDVYSDNTRKLKEIANKWKCCIMLLCHVTKEANKTHRDLAPFVRGSEKILDNADCWFSMSLCESDYANEEYIKDKGYLTFYNKRYSGNHIKKIYDFDIYTLEMTASKDDPDRYDVEEKTMKKPF